MNNEASKIQHTPGIQETNTDLPDYQQTEIKLQRSLAQLRLALTALDGFIYDYDIVAQRVERSEGLTQLLGYQLHEIPDDVSWWYQLIHPEDRASINLLRDLEGTIPASLSQQYRVRHTAGHYIAVWDRAIVQCDSQGKPIRLIGTTINMTAHKRVEERQRYLSTVSKILADSIEYETRLTDLAQYTVVSMADWCVVNLLDDNSIIVAAALAHRDPAREPALRQLCNQFPLHRTDSDGTAEVLRSGVSQWYPIVHEFDLRFEHMSDAQQQLWQQIGYRSLMIVPLIRQTKVTGSVTFMRTGSEQPYSADDLAVAEITAQRIALAIENARLYRAERIARAAAEQAAARFAFLNETGVVLSTSLDFTDRLNNLVRFTVPRFCDMCVIFVRTPDGSVYRAAAAHVDPEKERLLIKMQELGAIDPDGAHPAAAVIRNGQTVVNPDITASLATVQASLLPIATQALRLIPREQVIVPLIARQHVIGAISLGMDTSNREFDTEDIAAAEILASRAALMIDNARLYGDQQAAINLRDSFLLIASHELKTPLTAVIGQAQLLHHRLTQSGMASERDLRATRVIAEQALRLNKLISNLLDVSRLSQGQLELSREPVHLQGLLERVIGDFQPLLTHHTLTLHMLEQQLVIDGDPLRLEQVLQNLLQNALKYSPKGGTIMVSLEMQGAQALISVADHGIGIPAAELPRLFQRFYRVNNVAAQHMGGIGIGLYVVHEIVTLHGGNVFVESTEGEGSTFIVLLPLVVRK